MSQDYLEEQYLSVSLIYFSVGDLNLASRNDNVDQVIYLESYRKIAKTAEFIEGIIDLNGEIVILTDLRKVLKVAPQDEGEPMVIIYKFNDTMIGFIVDYVTRISRLNTQDFRPSLPVNISGVQEDCFYGIIIEEEESKNVLLINLEKVFSKQDINLLSSISEAV